MMRRFLTTAAALALLGSTASWVRADTHTGSLAGTVTSASGELLPGVTVTLTGPGGSRTQITNAQGGFRFLGLDPGSYQVQVDLEDFRSSDLRVQVDAGQRPTLRVTPASSEPAARGGDGGDDRRTRDFMSRAEEMNRLPVNRDYASLFGLAANTLSDVAAVGPSRALQRATFAGAGSSAADTTFLIDGIRVNDLSAIGQTPSWQAFEALEQVQVLKGPSGTEYGTGGSVITVVTRTGGNAFRGSGFFSASAGADYSEAGFQPADGLFDGSTDFSATLGGPLVRDRMWFYAAGGRQGADRTVFAADGETPGDMSAGTYTAKINVALGARDRLTGFFSGSLIERDGVGAGPFRGMGTTWTERSPIGIWKIEDRHTLNPNLHMAARFSRVRSDIDLDPIGGMTTPVQTPGGFSGSYWALDSNRTSTQFSLNGTYSLGMGGRMADLDFGVERYKFTDRSRASWPAGTLTVYTPTSSFPIAAYPPIHVSEIAVENNAVWTQYHGRYDRFSIDGGVRFDSWRGENKPSALLDNPLRPSTAPGGQYGGSSVAPDYSLFAPRAGIAYDLPRFDGARLYASFGRYASQLSTDVPALGNPIERVDPFRYTEYFQFIDQNQNQRYDGNESKSGSIYLGGYAASSPFAFRSPALEIADLKAPTLTRFTTGIAVDLSARSTLTAQWSYSRFANQFEMVPIVRDGDTTRPVRRDDWLAGPIINAQSLDGMPVLIQTYGLRSVLAPTGDTFLRTGDGSQTYNSFLAQYDIMGNRDCGFSGFVSLSSWRQRNGMQVLGFRENLFGPGDDDDAPAAVQSVHTFLNSGWEYGVRGYIGVARGTPWNVRLSGNWAGRQGNPEGERILVLRDEFTRALDAIRFGERRLDSVRHLDIGVEKEFDVNQLSLSMRLNGFNITNRQTVLERDTDLLSATAGATQRALNPRVISVTLQARF